MTDSWTAKQKSCEKEEMGAMEKSICVNAKKKHSQAMNVYNKQRADSPENTRKSALK